MHDAVRVRGAVVGENQLHYQLHYTRHVVMSNDVVTLVPTKPSCIGNLYIFVHSYTLSVPMKSLIVPCGGRQEDLGSPESTAPAVPIPTALHICGQATRRAASPCIAHRVSDCDQHNEAPL